MEEVRSTNSVILLYNLFKFAVFILNLTRQDFMNLQICYLDVKERNL